MSQHGDDTELSHFSLAEISKSTEDFSKDKKLGQGGFGPVYMGVLDDGRKIAVKKLLKTSRQGVYEFKNELQFIAKLQHRNLVKLLGYCNEGDERMLIYEHMPNKSLDYLIFDKIRSLTLDWSDRFHIIHGIVRGLLYLHHDSRFKIVHRDLKASNILLDANMNPKISDFGLARMGYMSPEYAVNGTFSEKSDVFSFGVLELEIVSGKTNRGFSREEKDEDNLLAHAWRLYEEDEDSEDYPAWKELDALVLQWILNTISDSLVGRVIHTATTTHEAWVHIEKVLLSNKQARAAALETTFVNLTLAACSSLDDYCTRLQDLANQLADVDHPITESRFVLQVVHGLPAEYDTTAALIHQNQADWDTARTMLNDEKIRLEARQQHQPSALAAATTPQTPSQPSSATAYYSTRGRGRGRGRSSRGGRGRGGGYRPNYHNNPTPNTYLPWNNTNNPPNSHPSPTNYPPWAWWMPPPCPYPTQPNTPAPNHTNNQSSSAHYAAHYPPPVFEQFGPASDQTHRSMGSQPDQQQQGNQSTGTATFAQGQEFDALQPSDIGAAFTTMVLNEPEPTWTMDTGATEHLTPHQGMIHVPSSLPVRTKILVGDGNCLPILGSGTGYHTLPNRNYILPNILYSPKVIKNLLSVRRFTRDNLVSIEFDPYGFSLKDLTTGEHLSRHNSEGDLYTFTAPEPSSCLVAASYLPWHDRLGHPGAQVLDTLIRFFNFPCNKNKVSAFCDSCHVSNSKRLPFYASTSTTFAPFDIIHCDLWTSPIPSKQGYKYCMVLIDNFTHFVWVYPLKFKSETFPTFTKFHRLIHTQFNRKIKTFQCDLGGEFDNNAFKEFANQNGLLFRFACPHTSSQNGRAERMIRRLNDVIRSLLIHANLPPAFWVEALHTAAYLHNILPTKRLKFFTPTFALYLRHPSYDHLRVFGCACYPNTSATQPHKLHPQANRCIFLGYPPDFRGYRCLDPTTGKVSISRHVTFDENTFPYTTPQPTTFQFLDDSIPPGFDFIPTQPTTTPPGPNPPIQTGPNPSVQPATPAPSQHSPPPFRPIIYTRRPKPAATSTSAQPDLLPTNSQPTQPAHDHHSHTSAAQSTTVPPNLHPMATRSKTGSSKPAHKLNLHTTTISPIPSTYGKAFTDPNWVQAMQAEFNALQVNDTWELVPRPDNHPVIRCMWLFRHKFKSDGSLERYMARLVVNGKSQTVGIDCDDTFSPVVKPATIRTVLSLAVSRAWPIHQLDVKNAFLHGHLNETVYMHQPAGFTDKRYPNFVCRLKKSLYGLKQAPRAWYNRFASYITSHGFKSSKCDNSLFVYSHGPHTAYLLLYVDDIVLTASSDSFLKQIIQTLSREFAMTDLGRLHHFLGIKVTHTAHGLFLNQEQYAKEIINRASMTNCKPCSTPVDLATKLSTTSGAPFPDPTLYRSLAGALQYLTFTRPDISYAVQQICLFMHDPREPHFAFMKRIIRYLQGTLNYGIRILRTPS
uniref:non-specific serine/threonine protein kinase n=1 Tax=Helianthus annuus TaxID=4232 RepID=A0A251T5P9_HELAN